MAGVDLLHAFPSDCPQPSRRAVKDCSLLPDGEGIRCRAAPDRVERSRTGVRRLPGSAVKLPNGVIVRQDKEVVWRSFPDCPESHGCRAGQSGPTMTIEVPDRAYA